MTKRQLSEHSKEEGEGAMMMLEGRRFQNKCSPSTPPHTRVTTALCEHSCREPEDKGRLLSASVP